MPDVTFKRVPIDQLHEDPANVRRHGDRNRAVVRASLKEFGQVETLVVQAGTGRVIGGNCRLQELRDLGVREVMVAEVDVDGVDATRLALVLNRSAELAEWDADGLADVLRGLDEPEMLGFDTLDMADVLQELEEDDAFSRLGLEPGEKPKKQPAVEVVIQMKDARKVEEAINRAIQMGARTRGEAMEQICGRYLDGF